MKTNNRFEGDFLFCLLALVLAFSVEAAWAGGLDTWHWRNPGAGANSLKGVAFGSGGFVTVGESGTIATSADGNAWSFPPRVTPQTLNRVIYANDLYVAVGESGSVLTSVDGTNWKVRSTGVTNSLLAAAYGNSRYLAVGNGGVVVASSDGVAWAPVSSDVSHNLGWLTFGNGLFMTAATNSSQVLTSVDGQHWTARTVFTSSNYCSIPAATYGNGQFLVCAISWWFPRMSPTYYQLNHYSSADGINWSNCGAGPATSVSQLNHLPLAFANGRFFESYTDGYEDQKFRVTSSEDGQSWSSTVLPLSAPLQVYPMADLAYGNGTYLLVGYAGTVLTSPEGTNWTVRHPRLECRLTGVAGAAGVYAAIGSGIRGPGHLLTNATPILVSTNGQSFREASSTASTNPVLASVACSGGTFVAVGEWGALQRSTDGVKWSVRPSGTSKDLMAVCKGSNLWVAVGDSGTLVTSSDGLAWSTRLSGTGYPLYGIGYGKGLYVAVGYMGTIVTSPDAITWTAQYTPTLNSLWGVAFGNDRFVVTGENGTVLTSSDGVTWLEQSSGTTNLLYGVAFGQGRFMAVGVRSTYLFPYEPDSLLNNNTLLCSSNGIEWSDITETLPTTLGLYGVAFVDNAFWLCGENGTLLQSDPVVSQSSLSCRIVPGSGVCELTITGTPGQRFRLQASSGFEANQWEDVASITNNPVPQTWIDSKGKAESQRFYRLVAP